LEGLLCWDFARDVNRGVLKGEEGKMEEGVKLLIEQGCVEEGA
jgi:hypothetical protein